MREDQGPVIRDIGIFFLIVLVLVLGLRSLSHKKSPPSGKTISTPTPEINKPRQPKGHAEKKAEEIDPESQIPADHSHCTGLPSSYGALEVSTDFCDENGCQMLPTYLCPPNLPQEPCCML